MAEVLIGEPVVAGVAQGTVLMSTEPLSFWGGYDQRTGEIIDRRHPLSGQCAAQRILAIPFTRGSSTTTAVLLQSVRAGVAPAAILTKEVDSFLALASVVADEMYEKPIPIIALAEKDFEQLAMDQEVAVLTDGTIRLL